MSEFHIQKNKDWNILCNWQGLIPGPVWIPYPEKQGLKLSPYTLKISSCACLNSISRKTRIETGVSTTTNYWFRCLNSISRKTRIETKYRDNYVKLLLMSEFHIQKNKDWNMCIAPLQTGKTVSEFHIQKNKDWNLTVKLVNPVNSVVWIPYPEKQGLKPRSTR